MPNFSIGDVRIHYDLSPGGARHIVLVHAYPTNSKMWEPQIEALSKKRTVVAYDVRGFGRSSAPDDASAYSQDRSVEDLLALLDHLKLEKADICGLSMGGNIALNFALAHPDRLSSLVVSGTGAGSGDRSAFMKVANRRAEIAETKGLAALFDELMGDPVFSLYANRGPEEKKRLRDLVLANPVAGVAHTARQVLAKRPPIPELEPRMRKMPVRTLLIAGEQDEAVAFSTSVMAKSLPNARVEIIPNASHFNNLEYPDLINRLLVEFLDA